MPNELMLRDEFEDGSSFFLGLPSRDSSEHVEEGGGENRPSAFEPGLRLLECGHAHGQLANLDQLAFDTPERTKNSAIGIHRDVLSVAVEADIGGRSWKA